MSFRELLAFDGQLNVADIGAAFIAEIPVYKKLLDANLAHLYAFDGDPRQAARIREAFGARVTLHSEFLADGTERTLYVADPQSGMSSLLKPDDVALGFFNGFDLFGKVLDTQRIATKRLDDVRGLPPIDFIKLDIQGSELDVLKNGPRTLEGCLAIQLEVSFVCLYEGQPSFGELDVHLRGCGFIPHCFVDVKRWSIKPTIRNNNFRVPFNQLLEADIVYIKNPMALGSWTDDQLKKMAIISHFCFSSFDLSVHVILELVRRKRLPEHAQAQYLDMLKQPQP